MGEGIALSQSSVAELPAAIETRLSIEDTLKLDRLYRQIHSEAQHFLGYPCNCRFDYSPLFRFLQFPLNNVGDPYLPSNYHLNTASKNLPKSTQRQMKIG